MDDRKLRLYRVPGHSVAIVEEPISEVSDGNRRRTYSADSSKTRFEPRFGVPEPFRKSHE